MREVNRVQRKMVQIILKAKRNPEESVDSLPQEGEGGGSGVSRARVVGREVAQSL
jgi:hypothetical protein